MPPDQPPKASVPEREEKRPAQLTVAPDIDSIKASWNAITTHIMKMRPSIGSSLVNATPSSYDDGILKLTFGADQNYHCTAVANKANEIAALLAPVLGVSVGVACSSSGEGNGAASNGGEKKKNEYDDMIAREPVINDILSRFGGEIIDTWRD